HIEDQARHGLEKDQQQPALCRIGRAPKRNDDDHGQSHRPFGGDEHVQPEGGIAQQRRHRGILLDAASLSRGMDRREFRYHGARMATPALPTGARILERCEALARCSEQPEALTRVYLSPEQRAASELTLSWMREAGMTERVDAVGNVVGRYEAARPGAP